MRGQETLEALRFVRESTHLLYDTKDKEAVATHLSLGNGSRGDDVGCHSIRTILEGRGVRQRIDGRFSRRNMRLEGSPSVVKSCADKDDPAAGPSRTRLDCVDIVLVSHLKPTSLRRDGHTRLSIHSMIACRFDQVGNRRFERVVRAHDVNFHNRFERVDRQLFNRRQEIPGRSGSAGQIVSIISGDPG